MTTHTRTGRLNWLDTLGAAALGLCAGAVVTTGVAAAIAFPTMRRLDPALPGFDVVGDHWLIAAGVVMARLFNAAAALEAGALLLATAALVTAITLARGRRNLAALLVRSVLLVALLGVFTHQWRVLMPRMNGNLTAFLDAARAGDAVSAEQHRAAFGADHTASSVELITVGALALLSALAAGWPIAREPRTTTPTQPADP